MRDAAAPLLRSPPVLASYLFSLILCSLFNSLGSHRDKGSCIMAHPSLPLSSMALPLYSTLSS